MVKASNRTIWMTPLLIVLLLLVTVSGAKAAPMVRVGLTVGGSAVRIRGSGLLNDPNGNVVTEINNSNLNLTAGSGQVWLSDTPYSFLRATPSSSGIDTYLQVNDKPYRGDLIISSSVGGIQVVNELGLEDYLLGVVPQEMSPSWPLEALKAQAVAARTFTLKNMNKHHVDGFDLCDTSHCQVYGGVAAEHEATSIAVGDTAGLVLKYDGDLIDAYYHASSGGRTETAGAAWGQDRPYLTVVDEEVDLADPYAFWEVSFSSEELGERLGRAGYPVGPVERIEISKRTPSGRAASVFVQGVYGTAEIAGTRLRQVLNLRSTLFDIDGQTVGEEAVWQERQQVVALVQGRNNSFTTGVPSGTHVITTGGTVVLKSRTASGDISRGKGKAEIILQGRGYGHGVGMSQWGAKNLAESQKEADKDIFVRILTHYYNGVTIEPY